MEKLEMQKSNKMKGERGGEIGFLPADIVREILSRLSVKCLLRYMCVSRHWKFIISHNSFKKLHRERSLNKNNPPLMLVFHSPDQSSYALTTFSLNGKVVEQWSLPMINPKSYLYMLPIPYQSKLVCFSNKESFVNRERFYLCKPNTRQLLCSLEAPSDLLPHGQKHACGFAYVPSKDEYVIVYLTNKMSNRSCDILTISISNDNDRLHYSSWKSINATSINNLKCNHPFGVFVCGAFYWYGATDVNVCLISFHVETEVFSTIRLPEVYEDESYLFNSLLEIKGELYVKSLSYRPRILKLWMLSDAKNQLWTHSWTINLQNIPGARTLNIDALIYRREYLQYYNDSYNILTDMGKLEIKTWLIHAMGIHNNFFSL